MSWSWWKLPSAASTSADHIPAPAAYGTLGLEIRAPEGAIVAVETTSDLSTWIETQRITGQGTGSPVKVTLQPDPNVQTKFWRVRIR